jgi:hypothetical protein
MRLPLLSINILQGKEGAVAPSVLEESRLLLAQGAGCLQKRPPSSTLGATAPSYSGLGLGLPVAFGNGLSSGIGLAFGIGLGLSPGEAGP